MITTHTIIFKNSNNMNLLPDESVDLVVTSPPYPMIEMWDDIFGRQNKRIGQALAKDDGATAFELMHRELDKVWNELLRVLVPGGIACINIGDATRTINAHFALYTNHARILTHMQQIGFSALPAILWRKQTNAPNKFMGSGMLPPGAYVTLEHEYVVILRKGNKREFYHKDEKQQRRNSSYFWEERNHWFSDVWMDLKGTSQSLFDPQTRGRSAAYPFELPYRLISMFSVKGDMVLDPFAGIGTTMHAAMAAGRNSTGYEIDPKLQETVFSHWNQIVDYSNQRIAKRLHAHVEFVKARTQSKGNLKYVNDHYHFPVMTKQEKELLINELAAVEKTDANSFKVSYSDLPQKAFTGDHWDAYPSSESEPTAEKRPAGPKTCNNKQKQQSLF